MEHVIKIAEFIFESFLHIWPYLFVTIPLAVIVQLTGAAKFIKKAFSKNPVTSILTATVLGAFSPFCSCGVIPVITSLLISGVPLAPVMSFWIASPSMDPEIFFLSVATIGLELSVWRLAATFFISLLAGYLTHFAITKGILGENALLNDTALSNESNIKSKKGNNSLQSGKTKKRIGSINENIMLSKNEKLSCCSTEGVKEPQKPKESNKEQPCGCNSKCETIPELFHKKLLKETWSATYMVIKFMGLAFFINALISFYLPEGFLADILGKSNDFSVVIATLIGIPAYTSNLTALPIISGLLSLGMNPGAALAFLIAGPTTTLPAMVAVWGIAKRRVFVLYLLFSLLGALLTGFIYAFFH